MNYANCKRIAAVVALLFSGGAYAQNNTLATPSTKSPANDTSGYGTPGPLNSDSGAWSANSSQPNNTNTSARPVGPAFGVNNTLARPTTKSPVAPQ